MIRFAKLSILLLSLIATQPLLAQHGGNVRYSGNVVNPVVDAPPPPAEPDFQQYRFEINGLYNASTAAYVAIFNIVQLGETAEEADNLISARFDALTEELNDMGIPTKDIHVDMISQVAIYEYQVDKKLFSKDNYLEIPQGIELQKNLHITFRDGSLMDDILAASAKQEIYDLVKVDYYLENQEAILHQLQKEVMEFHLIEKEMYKQLGVRLDTAKVAFTASTQVHYPIDRYQNYQSTSSSTLKGLKDEGGVQQIRKPNTMYYQPLSPNNFEVVINPLIEEPVVQFAYTLSIRYYFQPPPTVQIQIQKEIITQKEFLILTPDGNVRSLTTVNQD